MSKRSVNLLRKLAVPALHNSSNPETGVYKTWLAKTADYTCVAADSGKILNVNPAATTLIQLPAAAGNAGWLITIILDEAAGGRDQGEPRCAERS